MNNTIEFTGAKLQTSFTTGQASQGFPTQETADSTGEQYDKSSVRNLGYRR